MKTLPKKLRKNGFEYAQALRGTRSFIYAQRVCEDVINYEAFGRWAWMYRSWPEALKKYHELENNQSS